jgi:hypothetical protein
MAYCNNCGNQIHAENKFCAKCGKSLLADAAVQQTAAATESVNQNEDSASKNREWLLKNKWKVIGAIAGLFFLYFMYNNFINVNPEKRAKKMAVASCSITERKFDSLKIVYRSFLNDIKTKDTFVTKFKLDSLKNSIEQSHQAKSSENLDVYNKQFDKYKDADDKELFEITYREEMRNCAKMPRELEKLQSEVEAAMYNSSSSSSYNSSSNYDRPSTGLAAYPRDETIKSSVEAPASISPSPSLSSSSYGSSSSSYGSSSSNSYYSPDVVVKNYLSNISSSSSAETVYYSYLFKCTNYFGTATPNMQTIVDAVAPFKKKTYSATIKYRNVNVVKNGSANEVTVNFDYYYFDTKEKKYKLKTNQTVNAKLDATNNITEISGSQFE